MSSRCNGAKSQVKGYVLFEQRGFGLVVCDDEANIDRILVRAEFRYACQIREQADSQQLRGPPALHLLERAFMCSEAEFSAVFTQQAQ
jgi:hypothetical protein